MGGSNSLTLKSYPKIIFFFFATLQHFGVRYSTFCNFMSCCSVRTLQHDTKCWRQKFQKSDEKKFFFLLKNYFKLILNPFWRSKKFSIFFFIFFWVDEKINFCLCAILVHFGSCYATPKSQFWGFSEVLGCNFHI